MRGHYGIRPAPMDFRRTPQDMVTCNPAKFGHGRVDCANPLIVAAYTGVQTMLRAGIFSAIIATMFFSGLASSAQSSGHEEQLYDLVRDQTSDIWRPTIVKELMHFNMPESWWSALSDKTVPPVKCSNFASEINEYARKHGWGDVSTIESEAANADEAKKKIEEIVKGWKSKIGFTLNAESASANPESIRLGFQYMVSLGEYLYYDQFKPKDNVFMTIVVSPAAKDMTVNSADAVHLTITGPANVEVNDWSGKMLAGLQRAMVKR